MTTPLAPGVWGILATPFTGAELRVDTESLARQVGLFESLPATGVVALGVFGEGASLDSGEQAQVIDTVIRSSRTLPVVVGVSARSTAPAIEQALLAAQHSGDRLAGVMVQVNTASPDRLTEHLTAIHEATGAGIVLQDYPVASGVQISPEAVLRTVAACPFVVAVKAEAPPTALSIARLTKHTNVPVFGGLGGVGLLDELAAGAAGAMTGFSYPEALQETILAWREGGHAAAEKAFRRWLPLANFEAQPGIGLALRKEVLRRRGILTDAAVRPPAPPLPAELSAIMQAHLDLVGEVA